MLPASDSYHLFFHTEICTNEPVFRELGYKYKCINLLHQRPCEGTFGSGGGRGLQVQVQKHVMWMFSV